MKRTLLVFIILTLISCTNKKSNKPETNTSKNNLIKPIEGEKEAKPTDSIKDNFLKTQKNKNSPIKIISATLLKNQYSNHKDIKLTYKNITKKNIKAIKFEWYCENVFDEPASGQFFFVKGVTRKHTESLLKSRETESKIWEDFSTDANIIIAARAYYVVFSDGTKWQLNSKTTNLQD
ncbi:hypothetical protein [Flavobacterium sp. FlaQc-28]|uniref:hypothetical protein n=1 Tax=Flavobacterium sp. FlaQc-28 TaxID=3374178 RepID=UPI003756CFA5